MNSEKNSSEQIKRGAIISYIAICFFIVTGLVYTPWMIHQIGKSEYGLYTLAITLISFFTMDFGLGEAVARFLSKYNAENDQEKRRDFLGITFKLYMVLDALIFCALVVFFIFVDVIYAELTPYELGQFRVVFCIAALYSVASFPFMPLDGILISNERFMFQKLADLVNKILVVATMVIVLLLGYRLYSLVIVTAISGFLTIGLKLRYVCKHHLLQINFKANDKSLLKEIFRFSIWTTIVGVTKRFILNITPTVLAALAGSVQIALFSVAMSIEGYTWIFANALNGLFLPKVTRLTTNGENHMALENLMIRVGRIQLFMLGLIIVGLFTMGKEFMVLWMGADFVDAYYIVLLLIGTGIITLTQEIGDTALVAVNKIKYRAFGHLAVAGISVVLSLQFSRSWGAIGAGVAICIGNIVGRILIMNFVYYKILQINVGRFFRECHMKLGMPLLLAGGAGLLLQYTFPVDNLLLFVGKAGVFSVVYLVIMWSLALNDYEKNLFREILKKYLGYKGSA